MEVKSHTFQLTVLDDSHFQVPDTSTPAEDSWYHKIQGRVSPRAGLYMVQRKKSLPPLRIKP